MRGAKGALKAFIDTPVGKLSLITIAITAVVKIFQHFIVTLEEAQEKFEDTMSKLDEETSKLSSLSSQLAKIQDKIKEINDQDNLTFADKEQLELLHEESKELENQIALLEQKKNLTQKEVNQNAIDTANLYKERDFKTGKTSKERGQTGMIIGSVAGGAVGAFTLAPTLAAIGSAIAPVVGTVIGYGLGLIASAFTAGLAGYGIGNSIKMENRNVDASLANMRSQYDEKRLAYEEAQAAYMTNPNGYKNKEKYEKAKTEYNDYTAAMLENLQQLDTYYSSLDLSVESPERQKELRKEIESFYDYMDTWLIQTKTPAARENTLARIFGDNASDDVKAAKEAYIKALNDGEPITLEEAFGDNESAFKALQQRFRNLGLYVADAEAYLRDFQYVVEEVSDSSLYDLASSMDMADTSITMLINALTEANEAGQITAKTIMGLADVFSNTDGWDEYADVMMSGVASTEEMTKATEELAKAWLNDKVLNGPLDATEKIAMINQLTKIGVKNAQDVVNDAQETAGYMAVVNTLKRMQDAAEQYNDLVGYGTVGNVDYNKRPIISAEDMQQVYPEFEAGDMATTYDQGFYVQDDKGVKHAVIVTPILPDGTILSQEELDKYVDEVLQGNDILAADKEKIVIHAEIENSSDFWSWSDEEGQNVFDWEAFNDQLITSKESHLDAYLNLEDVAAQYGLTTEQVEKYIDKLKELAAAERELDALNEQQSLIAQRNLIQQKIDEVGGLPSYEEGLYDLNGNQHDYYYDSKGNIITEEEYNTIMEEMKRLQQELDAVNAQINNKYLSPNFNFEARRDELEAQVKALTDEIDTEITADVELKLQLKDNANDLVDEIQSVYDTLSNAAKEYAEQGYLNVDTVQALLQLDGKYLTLLYDENGQLNLNADTLYQVAAARLTDLKVKQQDALLTQAQDLAKYGSIEQLLRETDVLYGEADAYDVLIAKKLADIRLTLESRKDLAGFNINAYMNSLQAQLAAMEAMTNSAVANISRSLGGTVGTSPSSSAQEQADDAFQRAMDYWERRISASEARYQQVQNEIDLLEKQGKHASAEYYQEQLMLLEQKKALLESQKAEAQAYLNTFTVGSDEWF